MSFCVLHNYGRLLSDAVLSLTCRHRDTINPKAAPAEDESANCKSLFVEFLYIVFLQGCCKNCSSAANAHFIHPAVCRKTGPLSLPMPVLHTVRSRASSFNFWYPIFSLMSSCSYLRHLLRLTLTSTLPCIFPLTPCCIRQLIRKV